MPPGFPKETPRWRRVLDIHAGGEISSEFTVTETIGASAILFNFALAAGTNFQMTGRLLGICVLLTGCATYSSHRPATIVLHNESLDLVIQPDVGRIVKIEYQGRCDWLHFDPASTENVGGEFLWPVAHHYWKPLLGRIWPPPVVMESNLWRVVAVDYAVVHTHA